MSGLGAFKECQILLHKWGLVDNYIASKGMRCIWLLSFNEHSPSVNLIRLVLSILHEWRMDYPTVINGCGAIWALIDSYRTEITELNGLSFLRSIMFPSIVWRDFSLTKLRRRKTSLSFDDYLYQAIKGNDWDLANLLLHLRLGLNFTVRRNQNSNLLN